MPPYRGFPFQVVAEGKYGYKWAKWVTRIELSANTSFRGYWESQGYSNDAEYHHHRLILTMERGKSLSDFQDGVRFCSSRH